MKYIIDVPDTQEITYYVEHKMVSLKVNEGIVASEIYIDAEPYIEPDRKAIEDEVWEFVRMFSCLGNCAISEIGDDENTTDPLALVEKYSYQQAKAQYEAWKRTKEIRVGDEVETESGNKACVLYENPDGTQMFVFKVDGTAAWWSKCAIHKTGKNHPEVEELLKKMRGEQDG